MTAQHSQQLQQAYAQAAEKYNQLHTDDIEYPRADYFIRMLPPNACILDFGAGNGRDSRYFAEKNFDVTLLDNSPEMLAHARENVPNAHFIEADMVDVILEPDYFDGVWANASILHLTPAEAKRVIQKLFTTLKRNGILFIRVKEGEGEKVVGEKKYSSSGQDVDRYFSFYSKEQLSELVTQAGFEPITIESIFGTMNPEQKWLALFAKKP